MPIINPPTPASIGAVPDTRQLIAGSNITIDGGASADLNADVTIAATGGGGGSGVGNAVGAMVTNNAVQATTNNTITSITFQTETLDQDGFYNGANPTRLTVPRTGWYVFNASVFFEANSTGSRDAWFRLNGVTEILGRVGILNNAANAWVMTITYEAYLTAGDYLEVRARQTSGGNLNLLSGCTFSVVSIGVAGGMVKIDEVILAVDTNDINFASISPAYSDLILSFVGSSNNGAATELQINLNSDVSSNYDYNRWNNFGATSAVAQASMQIGSLPDSGDTDRVGQFDITFGNYRRTEMYKTCVSNGGVSIGTTSNDQIVGLSFGLWRDTSAITDILLSPVAGQFLAGTVAILYGRG